MRIGIDVGGTFTKAVAVDAQTLEVCALAGVPTTHHGAAGVSEGVAAALTRLLGRLADDRERVALVSFSTTQATNALLEGDVARVGVIGIGTAPDLRPARKRTKVGAIELARGRVLATEHEFLDATHGLDDETIDTALDRLEAAGCTAIAVSGAFAVDSPAHEQHVAERALARGLPACAGHELSGAYGLETRTVSAAINASILPVVERAAALVARALAESGVDVPLLVLRGDGGAMSIGAFRRRPSFTVGSGPAAGVAAALQELGISEGIVVECGGTSSNVSVVKRGRAVLKTLRVMGRPTCIRSIDSWVVGAAGGSLARLGRRGIAEVGPRSAHIAGLPYASFATVDALAGAELELVAPRPGDLESYAVVRTTTGDRYALTATCAANALGLVPDGSYAAGSRGAAVAAFAPLARRLGASVEQTARKVLDGAVARIAEAVAEAARQNDLAANVPLVALGGAGAALVPEVAHVVGRPVVIPRHAEVLSSVGAALSLVRAEVTRSAAGEIAIVDLSLEAERACVALGAAPASVTVETSFEQREGVVRAVATGAVALETGAAGREASPEPARLQAAAEALSIDETLLSLLARTEYYTVYSENGSGRVAVVDQLGAVPVAEDARRVFTGDGETFLERLAREVEAGSRKLGVATMLPRVVVVCGSRILDLSEARRAEEIVEAARHAVGIYESPAIALLTR